MSPPAHAGKFVQPFVKTGQNLSVYTPRIPYIISTVYPIYTACPIRTVLNINVYCFMYLSIPSIEYSKYK